MNSRLQENSEPRLLLLQRLASWLVGGLLLAALAIPLVALNFLHSARNTRAQTTPTINPLPNSEPLPTSPASPTTRPHIERPIEPAEPEPPPVISSAALSSAEAFPDAADVEPPPSPTLATSAPAESSTTPRGPLDRSAAARTRRIHEFGGTRGTETAVEAGLAWLAAHQDLDGIWNRFEYPRRCPNDDRCTGVPVTRTEANLTPGITGIALLAFLGAGYTDRDGPYEDTIHRGIQALLRMQQPHGGFGLEESNAGYNDAVATFALAEFYALTGEPAARAAVERGLSRLAATQQALGGWDYLPRPDTGRNDTSISAWAVQALQAASVAGLPIPPGVMAKAALHFARAAQEDGRVWYADAGTGYKLDDKTLRPAYRFGPAMLAAGLTCEQLLGWRTDALLPRKQAALLLAELPSGAEFQGGDKSGLHSEYYWYYGTICLFQAGGPNWERWNGRMRDALLPLQSRAKRGDGSKAHEYGSFPPFGPTWGQWGRIGGRIYSTAINVLTLEIYYRHTPNYLEEHAPLTPADWRTFVENTDPRTRMTAVQTLSELQLQIGEPVLRELLAYPDLGVAAAAAQALTTIDSPLGLGVLRDASAKLGATAGAALAPALQRAQTLAALPPATGKVRLVDERTRLATVELTRSFAGMKLRVERSGQPPRELVVTQRFSGRNVAVAEIAAGVDLPHAGDSLLSTP